MRLFHLAAAMLHAIELGVFVPNPGWQRKDCPFKSRCWAPSASSVAPGQVAAAGEVRAPGKEGS